MLLQNQATKQNKTQCRSGRVFTHFVEHFLSSYFYCKLGDPFSVSEWSQLCVALASGEEGFQMEWLSKQQLPPPPAPSLSVTCQGLQQRMHHCPHSQSGWSGLVKQQALEPKVLCSHAPAPGSGERERRQTPPAGPF